MAKNKVVLAYSGGLDTSIMIRWLIDHYDCDVVAMCANLGQAEEIDGLEDRAKAAGASAVYIEDLQDDFVENYIFPTLRAGAVYENRYLLGTSFARPLIAKRQVEIAALENANMVAHGATGKGNDQVRFELAYMALNPKLQIVAPWKDPQWTLNSREACIDYANEHGIEIKQTKEKIYSEDRNIWHISHEGAELEDPINEAKNEVFTLSNTIENAPDKAEYIELEFKNGTPIKLNGTAYNAVGIVKALNKIGAQHGIGQIDLIENRLVGMKSRGVYETPGGTILYFAHQYIESLVLDKQTMHYKQSIGLKYAELVYNGEWFCPLREALDAFVKQTQQVVNGTVKLKLYKGNIVPAGASAEKSMYVKDLASFENTQLYDQKDANGFIRIFGLPLKVNGMVNRNETN